MKQDDRLLIYFAGHGQYDLVSEEGYWQAVDAQIGIPETWIANKEIAEILSTMPSKHVLVLADAGHSGSPVKAIDIVKSRPIDDVVTHASRKVITSGGFESVSDLFAEGHSVFSFFCSRFCVKCINPTLRLPRFSNGWFAKSSFIPSKFHDMALCPNLGTKVAI